MALYNHIRETLLTTLQAQRHGVPDGAQSITLETPRDSKNGDLASNAAMVLAKSGAGKPMDLGAALTEALAGQPVFKSVGLAAPGFINFTLQDADLYADCCGISRVVDAPVAGQGRKKALVEYVSINPTGPIHVGHGRNAVFGDAIANLLERAGQEVWREYLVNDAGGQIRVLVTSLHARYRQLLGDAAAQLPENGYPGEYVLEMAEALRARDGDRWKDCHDEDALLAGLRQFAVEYCMGMIKADIATMGIRFDHYFSEHEMHRTDTMRQAVQVLRDKGYVYEGVLPPPKGKEVTNYEPVELTLFRATAFGFPEDQAIYKRNGEPTYFGQDIAYHYDKIRRGYNFLVTVLGADQAGSFRPLEKVVEALSGEAGIYHPVPYEMVKVVRDGVPVKLSKRAGNIVLLSDVLEEVGKDAFRFMMLTVKPTTQLVFDLAKAVEKSMENPVFYVQYAHARLASVWRQEGVQELNLTPETEPAPLPDGWQFSAESRAVMVTLMRWPLVLEQAARALEPHRLATYAQELAASIHKWYVAERWLDAADTDGSKVRLSIAHGAQARLQDVLVLCGVSAPESM